MKTLLTGIIALFSFTLNAQNMKNPNDVVTKLFISTDQRNWSEVEKCFAEEVVLDYSSMTGNPAGTLTPSEIVSAWKGILPGFEHTHHQVGNFVTSQNGDKAQVFCYGTATHFLEDEAGNVWTVVGSYDFELAQTSKDAWQVSRMKFNFKYQNGNTSLHEKAIQRVNNK
ncbi:nuclear transport factor 2 family protein [Fulvivirgaceae bacterium BMA12]|uniref:Nuclear transport factor 2 family protein n=1 Tax=Agaribacillus aureus TaxID=3051825 RepID=A0ABT8LLS0_9BACT|nr:nuclear transport factor 2 family protein [Fulvivirgaceae bacterium BMA12]